MLDLSWFRVPYWKILGAGDTFIVQVDPTSQETVIVFVNEIEYPTDIPGIGLIDHLLLGTPSISQLQNSAVDLSRKFKGCFLDPTVTLSNSTTILIEESSAQSDTLLVTSLNADSGCLQDDYCAQFASDPCENGASCTDIFWGYSCQNCPLNFHGQNCSQVSLCYDDNEVSIDGVCKSGLTCVDVSDSYEC